MTYQETLDYMYDQLPMFHRVGIAAYKPNLYNTIAICNLLNNPQHQFKTIHIAGTNGKGSTSHLLASVLQRAGLKVGLYTSPHLKDFRERIKINGEMIPQQQVINFITKYKSDFEKIQPSFFEMTVGLAFNYFASQKVDIAVIEVGLGGRLDSTNVINPEVAVITNISFDHISLLGNTLAKIAAEKAGIIKKNIPIVIGETQAEIKDVFIGKSKDENARIVFADKIYKARNANHVNKNNKTFLCMDVYKQEELQYENLEVALPGLYQLKNIQTILAVIDMLNEKGYQLTENIVREGLKKVVSQTGLQGRWQVLAEQPLIIADIGHNEAGIKEVVAQLNTTSYQGLHVVLGMVNDKDVSTVLNLLPTKATYYFCKAAIPRAMEAGALAVLAKNKKLLGDTYSSVFEALNAAKTKAKANDLILITGSTFVVAEVI
ncbi:MAG: folylpolyglutamate synthase/dihydrofolate synthase family protein [Bacteroidia bacterium]